MSRNVCDFSGHDSNRLHNKKPISRRAIICASFLFILLTFSALVLLLREPKMVKIRPRCAWPKKNRTLLLGKGILCAVDLEMHMAARRVPRGAHNTDLVALLHIIADINRHAVHVRVPRLHAIAERMFE